MSNAILRPLGLVGLRLDYSTPVVPVVLGPTISLVNEYIDAIHGGAHYTDPIPMVLTRSVWTAQATIPEPTMSLREFITTFLSAIAKVFQARGFSAVADQLRMQHNADLVVGDINKRIQKLENDTLRQVAAIKRFLAVMPGSASFAVSTPVIVANNFLNTTPSNTTVATAAMDGAVNAVKATILSGTDAGSDNNNIQPTTLYETIGLMYRRMVIDSLNQISTGSGQSYQYDAGLGLVDQLKRLLILRSGLDPDATPNPDVSAVGQSSPPDLVNQLYSEVQSFQSYWNGLKALYINEGSVWSNPTGSYFENFSYDYLTSGINTYNTLLNKYDTEAHLRGGISDNNIILGQQNKVDTWFAVNTNLNKLASDFNSLSNDAIGQYNALKNTHITTGSDTGSVYTLTAPGLFNPSYSNTTRALPDGLVTLMIFNDAWWYPQDHHGYGYNNSSGAMYLSGGPKSPPYDASQSYSVGNTVTYNNNTYLAVVPIGTGVYPGQDFSWQNVGTNLGISFGPVWDFLPDPGYTYYEMYAGKGYCDVGATGQVYTASKNILSVADVHAYDSTTYNAQTTYSPATTTFAGNIVTQGGSFYQCIATTTGHSPTNTTYWRPVLLEELHTLGHTYQSLDLVHSADGIMYQCLTTGVPGSTALTDTTKWRVIDFNNSDFFQLNTNYFWQMGALYGALSSQSRKLGSYLGGSYVGRYSIDISELSAGQSPIIVYSPGSRVAKVSDSHDYYYDVKTIFDTNEVAPTTHYNIDYMGDLDAGQCFNPGGIFNVNGTGYITLNGTVGTYNPPRYLADYDSLNYGHPYHHPHGEVVRYNHQFWIKNVNNFTDPIAANNYYPLDLYHQASSHKWINLPDQFGQNRYYNLLVDIQQYWGIVDPRSNAIDSMQGTFSAYNGANPVWFEAMAEDFGLVDGYLLVGSADYVANTFVTGDLVISIDHHGGDSNYYYWRAATTPNSGAPDSTAPGNWTKIASPSYYNHANNYSVGDIVISNDNFNGNYSLWQAAATPNAGAPDSTAPGNWTHIDVAPPRYPTYETGDIVISKDAVDGGTGNYYFWVAATTPNAGAPDSRVSANWTRIESSNNFLPENRYHYLYDLIGQMIADGRLHNMISRDVHHVSGPVPSSIFSTTIIAPTTDSTQLGSNLWSSIDGWTGNNGTRGVYDLNPSDIRHVNGDDYSNNEVIRYQNPRDSYDFWKRSATAAPAIFDLESSYSSGDKVAINHVFYQFNKDYNYLGDWRSTGISSFNSVGNNSAHVFKTGTSTSSNYFFLQDSLADFSSNDSYWSDNFVVHNSGLWQRTDTEIITDTGAMSVSNLLADNFVNYWSSDHTYSTGNYVLYNGNYYKYINNTSTSGHATTDATYWTSVTIDDMTPGGWTPGVTYSLNQYVYNGVALYRYVDTTPGVASSSPYTGWHTSTPYEVGQLVFADNAYKFAECIQAHTSGATTEPFVGGSSATYWRLANYEPGADAGVSWGGGVNSWLTGQEFTIGQYVSDGSKYWECTQAHTSGALDDEPGVGAVSGKYWTEGGINVAVWDSTTTYSTGDHVFYNGGYYEYINNTSTSGHATTNATYWVSVTGSAWVTGHNYVIDDYVSGSGAYWKCILNHTSGAHSDEPGVGAVNSTYWTQVDLSTPIWATGNTYSLYDYVYHSGSYYKYMHASSSTSATSNEPGAGHAHSDYWTAVDISRYLGATTTSSSPYWKPNSSVAYSASHHVHPYKTMDYLGNWDHDDIYSYRVTDSIDGVFENNGAYYRLENDLNDYDYNQWSSYDQYDLVVYKGQLWQRTNAAYTTNDLFTPGALEPAVYWLPIDVSHFLGFQGAADLAGIGYRAYVFGSIPTNLWSQVSSPSISNSYWTSVTNAAWAASRTDLFDTIDNIFTDDAQHFFTYKSAETTDINTIRNDMSILLNRLSNVLGNYVPLFSPYSDYTAGSYIFGNSRDYQVNTGINIHQVGEFDPSRPYSGGNVFTDGNNTFIVKASVSNYQPPTFVVSNNYNINDIVYYNSQLWQRSAANAYNSNNYYIEGSFVCYNDHIWQAPLGGGTVLPNNAPYSGSIYWSDLGAAAISNNNAIAPQPMTAADLITPGNVYYAGSELFQFGATFFQVSPTIDLTYRGDYKLDHTGSFNYTATYNTGQLIDCLGLTYRVNTDNVRLTHLLAYNANTSFAPGDYVAYGNDIWEKMDNAGAGNTPQAGDHWSLHTFPSGSFIYTSSTPNKIWRSLSDTHLNPEHSSKIWWQPLSLQAYINAAGTYDLLYFGCSNAFMHDGSYEVGDYVAHNGNTFLVIHSTTGINNFSTNTSYSNGDFTFYGGNVWKYKTSSTHPTPAPFVGSGYWDLATLEEYLEESTSIFTPAAGTSNLVDKGTVPAQGFFTEMSTYHINDVVGSGNLNYLVDFHGVSVPAYDADMEYSYVPGSFVSTDSGASIWKMVSGYPTPGVPSLSNSNWASVSLDAYVHRNDLDISGATPYTPISTSTYDSASSAVYVLGDFVNTRSSGGIITGVWKLVGGVGAPGEPSDSNSNWVRVHEHYYVGNIVSLQVSDTNGNFYTQYWQRTTKDRTDWNNQGDYFPGSIVYYENAVWINNGDNNVRFETPSGGGQHWKKYTDEPGLGSNNWKQINTLIPIYDPNESYALNAVVQLRYQDNAGNNVIEIWQAAVDSPGLLSSSDWTKINSNSFVAQSGLFTSTARADLNPLVPDTTHYPAGTTFLYKGTTYVYLEDFSKPSGYSASASYRLGDYVYSLDTHTIWQLTNNSTSHPPAPGTGSVYWENVPFDEYLKYSGLFGVLSHADGAMVDDISALPVDLSTSNLVGDVFTIGGSTDGYTYVVSTNTQGIANFSLSTNYVKDSYVTYGGLIWRRTQVPYPSGISQIPTVGSVYWTNIELNSYLSAYDIDVLGLPALATLNNQNAFNLTHHYVAGDKVVFDGTLYFVTGDVPALEAYSSSATYVIGDLVYDGTTIWKYTGRHFIGNRDNDSPANDTAHIYWSAITKESYISNQTNLSAQFQSGYYSSGVFHPTPYAVGDTFTSGGTTFVTVNETTGVEEYSTSTAYNVGDYVHFTDSHGNDQGIWQRTLTWPGSVNQPPRTQSIYWNYIPSSTYVTESGFFNDLAVAPSNLFNNMSIPGSSTPFWNESAASTWIAQDLASQAPHYSSYGSAALTNTSFFTPANVAGQGVPSRLAVHQQTFANFISSIQAFLDAAIANINICYNMITTGVSATVSKAFCNFIRLALQPQSHMLLSVVPNQTVPSDVSTPTDISNTYWVLKNWRIVLNTEALGIVDSNHPDIVVSNEITDLDRQFCNIMDAMMGCVTETVTWNGFIPTFSYSMNVNSTTLAALSTAITNFQTFMQNNTQGMLDSVKAISAQLQKMFPIGVLQPLGGYQSNAISALLDFKQELDTFSAMTPSNMGSRYSNMSVAMAYHYFSLNNLFEAIPQQLAFRTSPAGNSIVSVMSNDNANIAERCLRYLFENQPSGGGSNIATGLLTVNSATAAPALFYEYALHQYEYNNSSYWQGQRDTALSQFAGATLGPGQAPGYLAQLRDNYQSLSQNITMPSEDQTTVCTSNGDILYHLNRGQLDSGRTQWMNYRQVIVDLFNHMDQAMSFVDYNGATRSACDTMVTNIQVSGTRTSAVANFITNYLEANQTLLISDQTITKTVGSDGVNATLDAWHAAIASNMQKYTSYNADRGAIGKNVNALITAMKNYYGNQNSSTLTALQTASNTLWGMIGYLSQQVAISATSGVNLGGDNISGHNDPGNAPTTDLTFGNTGPLSPYDSTYNKYGHDYFSARRRSGASISFTGTNISDNTITKNGHGFSTGDQVVFDTSNLGIGSLQHTYSTGANSGQTRVYYVIRVDANHLRVADSLGHAQAGTPIVLTSPDVNTTYTLSSNFVAYDSTTSVAAVTLMKIVAGFHNFYSKLGNVTRSVADSPDWVGGIGTPRDFTAWGNMHANAGLEGIPYNLYIDKDDFASLFPTHGVLRPSYSWSSISMSKIMDSAYNSAKSYFKDTLLVNSAGYISAFNDYHMVVETAVTRWLTQAFATTSALEDVMYRVFEADPISAAEKKLAAKILNMLITLLLAMLASNPSIRSIVMQLSSGQITLDQISSNFKISRTLANNMIHRAAAMAAEFIERETANKSNSQDFVASNPVSAQSFLDLASFYQVNQANQKSINNNQQAQQNLQ